MHEAGKGGRSSSHSSRDRRRRSSLALVALLSVVAWPGAVPTARAQGQASAFATSSGRPASPQLAAGERPPANLAEALEKADWNPEERGPLLIVAPEMAKALAGRNERQADGNFRYVPPPVLKPAGPEGYRLTVIDSHFGRKLTQVGGLWAVVPEKMSVLNSTRLPEPDPYMGMSREQKMRLLQSRFTAAQWKLAASPQGIGANDLDAEQRTLFLAALPDPFRVQVIRPNPEGGMRAETITVSRAQAAGVRIALRRQLSWSFAYENQANGAVSIGVGGSPDGSPQLTLAYEVEDWEARRRKMLDVALVEEVSNHLKEGDIHFAAPALNALVPIADARTVGELVQLVAKATRSELYADPRYAALPVHARARGGVRAGDVLQALCLSVTGTFRKVEAGPTAGGAGGAAYVLTDDREGLAVRHARIAQWLRKAGRLRDEREMGVAQRMTAMKPIDQVTWTAGDPMAPDPALQKKIDAHRETASKPRDPNQPSDYYSRYPMVPVAELPAAARQMVQKQVESWSGNNFSGEQQKIRTDAVRLDVRMSTALLVPGVGAVEGQGGFGGFGGSESLFGSIQDRFVPPPARPQEEVTLPVSLPAGMAERYLFVRAKTADEAKRAAATAKQRGFTALWLEAAVGMPIAEFAAQVKAAREAVPGLRVFAMVRALRLGAGEAGKVPADVNLFGETTTATASRHAKEYPKPVTDPRNPEYYAQYEMFRTLEVMAQGDYPRLDVPAARAAVRARALEIARTPGLAGVVLRDLMPPGSAVGPDYMFGNDARSGRQEFEVGYSPETRLAFLRKTGVDPVDLSALSDENVSVMGRYGGESGNIALPFFRNYGVNARNWTINGKSAIEMGAKDAGEQWARFRGQLAVEFQNDLWKALQGVTGADGKPIALLREDPTPGGLGTIGTMTAWTQPAAMPPAPETGRGSRQPPGRPDPFTGLWTVSPAQAIYFVPDAEKDLPPADRFGMQIGRMSATFAKQASQAARPIPTATARPFRPSGMLIDLSDMPVDEALPLLGQIRPPAPGKPAAPRAAR
ncbi:MAG TPA: hypothetical protein VM490_16795 [Armatimonadaceae bacterium]|nr:hypothetical protein [Armatimonadaceae bacterium]